MRTTMKELLESGVHFGHQTRRWNPKMAKYIFAERNGIYIIDLQKTLRMIETACDYVQDIAAQGGTALFVGTKRQSQEAVLEEATRCQMFYVSHRWLGWHANELPNLFAAVFNDWKSWRLMKPMASFNQLPKKEVIRLARERTKLTNNLTGIKGYEAGSGRGHHYRHAQRTTTAILEANKLGIPVIGIVDNKLRSAANRFPDSR